MSDCPSALSETLRAHPGLSADAAFSTWSHTYPSLDEYESMPTPTGLWRLWPGRVGSAGASGPVMQILTHSPSGAFDPMVDSSSRIIYTRWDHLQQDQQLAGSLFGPVEVDSEASTAAPVTPKDGFPEPLTASRDAMMGAVNGLQFNMFNPWMLTLDTSGGVSAEEVINHVGRHELQPLQIPASFTDDADLLDYAAWAPQGLWLTKNTFEIHGFGGLMQVREDPAVPGRFVGVLAHEFGEQASNQ